MSLINKVNFKKNVSPKIISAGGPNNQSLRYFKQTYLRTVGDKHLS